MHLPEYQLFLGFAVGSRFANALDRINPYLKEMFIDGKEYLQQVEHHEIVYLGKTVGKRGDLPKIMLLEANIYSILSKLVPDFPCHEVPLHLFAVECSS